MDLTASNQGILQDYNQAKEALLKYKEMKESGLGFVTLGDITQKVLEHKHSTKFVTNSYARQVSSMYEVRTMYEQNKIDELVALGKFEVENPTDFSIPNVLDSYFRDPTKMPSDLAYNYKNNRSKAISYRFSKGDAMVMANLALPDMINAYKERFGVFPSDDEILGYYHAVAGNLSIEYWANHYMFPDGYDGTNEPIGSGTIVRDSQRILWENNNRYITLTLPRQEGKTFACATVAFHTMATKEGFSMIYVLESATQARDILSKYVGTAGSRVHPCIWDTPHFHLDKSTFQMTMGNPSWQQPSILYTAFGKVGGQSRYVGKTVKLVIADEVGTYGFDPIPFILPCIKQNGPFSRLITTSTVRATVGNPYNDLLSNRQYRQIYRNIHTAIIEGSIETSQYLEFQATSKTEEDFMTEYLCESPEGLSSLITKSDILNPIQFIDLKLENTPVITKVHQFGVNGLEVIEENDTRSFFLRDPRIDQLRKKPVEYFMGIDWNPGKVGHVIYILAKIDNPDPEDYKTNPDAYVIYDVRQLKGSHCNKSGVITINTLIDRYMPKIIACDFGASDGITTLWKEPAYSVTKNGYVIYDKDKDQLVGIRTLNFTKMGKITTADGRIITHRLNNVLINQSIDLVKRGMLIIPRQESPHFKLSMAPYVNSEIFFLKDINVPLDYDTATIHNLDSNFMTRQVRVPTYLDELKNMVFDSKDNKYKPEYTASGLGDDHIAAVSTIIHFIMEEYHPEYATSIEPVESYVSDKASEKFSAWDDLASDLNIIETTAYKQQSLIENKPQTQEEDFNSLLSSYHAYDNN